MLKTREISRLAKAGNYAAHCPKVNAKSSNNSKGKGNKKNSNKYQSWAFSEASELASLYKDIFSLDMVTFNGRPRPHTYKPTLSYRKSTIYLKR